MAKESVCKDCLREKCALRAKGQHYCSRALKRPATVKVPVSPEAPSAPATTEEVKDGDTRIH